MKKKVEHSNEDGMNVFANGLKFVSFSEGKGNECESELSKYSELQQQSQ